MKLMNLPLRILSFFRHTQDKYSNEYLSRRKLLDDVFKKSIEQDRPSISFELLTSIMRAESRKNQFLSSIYFAGGQSDHPYFLNTENIAIGISVLPEDKEKAGLSKKHPHQIETIFVVEGSLRIFTDQLESSQILRLGDVFQIPKGVCHRIEPIDNKPATFIFVKTNPSQEPRGEDCSIH